MRSGTNRETTVRSVIFLNSKSFARGRAVMKSQAFNVAEEQRGQLWPAMDRRSFHLRPNLDGFATQGRSLDPELVDFACHSAFLSWSFTTTSAATSSLLLPSATLVCPPLWTSDSIIFMPKAWIWGRKRLKNASLNSLCQSRTGRLEKLPRTSKPQIPPLSLVVSAWAPSHAEES